MSVRKLIAVVSIFLLPLLSGSTAPGVASAQGVEGWQPPTRLAVAASNNGEGESVVITPVIVADDWGNAHAFWQGSNSDSSGMLDSSIYYARWDTAGWSQPVEIFLASRRFIQLPQAAADSQGLLHLIWEDGTGGALMYAHAPVTSAGDARAWSSPERIGEFGKFTGEVTNSLVVAPSGELHVVYCAGSENPSVVHTYLSDQGQWSQPVTVQAGSGDHCRVSVARDGRGRLHLLYALSMRGGIFYSQSDDQGASWSSPLEIADWKPDFQGEYFPTFPGIVTSGDTVHIVWLGYPRNMRWHQWSSDRGATWSAPVQISPDLALSTDVPALVVDGAGVLHLVSVGSLQAGGPRPYYARWQAGTWSPLTEVYKEADERAALAMTTNGTLHLIWDNHANNQWSIMASSLALGSAGAPLSEAALPPPSPTAVAGTIATPVTRPLPSPTPAVVESVPERMDVSPDTDLGTPSVILMSSLSAGLFVALCVFVVLKRRTR